MHNKEPVSATVEDWSREKPCSHWDPSRKLLCSIRSYQRLKDNRMPLAWFGRKLCVFRYRFWSVVTGAEIDLNCKIGGGLQIPHPNGIIIHPRVKIGPNCMIFQQVTLGINMDGGVPKLGGNVMVGAGAKVIGSLEIGDNARIGVNSVVLDSVAEGQIVVGIPARIVTKGHDKKEH